MSTVSFNEGDSVPGIAHGILFENVEIAPEIQEVTTDYTLWQIGPGKYYSTEAKVAKERNLRMYCKANF